MSVDVKKKVPANTEISNNAGVRKIVGDACGGEVGGFVLRMLNRVEEIKANKRPQKDST